MRFMMKFIHDSCLPSSPITSLKKFPDSELLREVSCTGHRPGHLYGRQQKFLSCPYCLEWKCSSEKFRCQLIVLNPLLGNPVVASNHSGAGVLTNSRTQF